MFRNERNKGLKTKIKVFGGRIDVLNTIRICAVVLAAMLGSVGGAIAADEVAVRDLTRYYEKEGVDLSQYTAIMIDRLGLDDARVMPPPWYEGEDSSPQKWQLTDSDIKWLRKSYRETLTAEIEKGGYPVVDQPGDGVLILDIEIIYLMPYARRGENVTTRGFGEMLVQAQFRDGMSQELLAVYEGKQNVGSEYQQNTRLNNESSLRELFQYWGSRVRGIMDAAKLE